MLWLWRVKRSVAFYMVDLFYSLEKTAFLTRRSYLFSELSWTIFIRCGNPSETRELREYVLQIGYERLMDIIFELTHYILNSAHVRLEVNCVQTTINFLSDNCFAK